MRARGRLIGGALALCLTAALLSLAPLPRRDELAFEWITGALLCSCVVWLLRVARLRAHLTGHPQRSTPSAATLARVVATHTLLARLAPMKLGELGLPYLLAREGVSVSDAAIFLLWARVIELWLLLVGALAALAVSGGWGGGAGGLLEALNPSAALYGALIALPLTLLALTPLIPTLLRRAARALSDLTARAGTPPRARALTLTLTHALLHTGEAAPLTLGRVARLTALSALILSAQALMFGCFARACSPHALTPSALWVGAAGAHLGGVVPLPTLGSVGGHEAGWVAGFTAVGLPLPAAVLSAVLSQWVTLAFAALWWGVARSLLRGR